MEIAVCDDNKLFLKEFEIQLQTFSMVENIFVFSDLEAFLFSIEESKYYDVVFMDIEWDKEIAGMDVAMKLYKLCPKTKIIYITGHVEQFSQQIFLHRVNLSGYLTKPIDINLLHANLQKVADALLLQEQPTLVIHQQGLPISIPLREIYFIESRGHTIQIHTVGETITTYERLENIRSFLSAGFYQCHKSYIVNMSQIRRFESNNILLKNGERVPISRARYAETKEAYFKYMGQKF